MLRRCALLVCLMIPVACAEPRESYRGRPVYTATVLASFPHDTRNFTQGLVYHQGALIEGTGLYGQSRLLRRSLESAEAVQATALAPEFFGEGITVVGDRVVQLTWKAQLGFVYDLATLQPISQFSYATEGWGLAFDGERLIKSDGTPLLEFMDPGNYAVTGGCRVTSDGRAVTRINELEMVGPLLYANVWGENYVARIELKSCKVRDWIDLTDVAARFVEFDVLNGIAWDAEGERLFVTGKYWPSLLQIEVPPYD